VGEGGGEDADEGRVDMSHVKEDAWMLRFIAMKNTICHPQAGRLDTALLLPSSLTLVLTWLFLTSRALGISYCVNSRLI
jgi:hypothetical protein